MRKPIKNSTVLAVTVVVILFFRKFLVWIHEEQTRLVSNYCMLHFLTQAIDQKKSIEIIRVGFNKAFDKTFSYIIKIFKSSGISSSLLVCSINFINQ